MYIQPNSTIEVMRGVPLTTSNTDTFFFATEGMQDAYFSGRVAYTFTAQSYQRVDRQTCRLERNAEDLYNCNYMRFKNNAFGNKWFYAFIIGVEYVNNSVSEVTYQLDPLQTWALDYQLGKCFVEREHSASDQIGEHLLPEPVDPGEPYCQSMTSAGFNEMSIVLVVAFDEQHGEIREGVYTGCAMYVEPATAAGITAIDGYINQAMGQSGGADSIVAIYMAPTAFATQQNTPTTLPVTLTRPQTIAGFEPNNKKLLTYPYTFLTVDTLNDSHVYRYEYFGGEVPVFECTGTVMSNPSVVIAPVDYELNQYTNYTQQIVMGGYPQCSFNIDTYKQWLAANGVYNKMSVISSAGAMVAGAASGNILGMGAGLVGITSAVAHDRVESQRANTSRGSVSTNVNVANRTKDVYFKVMGVKPEKARALDDFFSRYGYTCERVKVPNRAARKRWTYTKTKDCVVKGNVPADDLAKIAAYFDRGITFWMPGYTPGDYVMDDNGPGVG